MKKAYLVGILVLAVIVGVFFWLISGGHNPSIIVSGDGMLTLSIPEGALPEGFSRRDIAIKPLSGAAFFGEGVEAPGPAYELLPDGLVFKKPVVLTLHSEANGTVPQLLHVSGEGETELLNPTKLRVDRGANTVDAEFAILHFSKVGADARRGTFRYEFISGGTAPVGGTLPYSVVISVDTHNHWFSNGLGWEPDTEEAFRRSLHKKEEQYILTHTGGYSYRVAPGTIYTVEAFDAEARGGKLIPATLAAPRWEQKEYEMYHFDGSFTCAKAGRTSVYNAGVTIRYRMMNTRGGKTNFEEDETMISFYSEDYLCIAEEEAGGEKPKATPTIDVIEYEGRFLPVSDMHTGNHASGCGEDHWHADAPVTATDGTVISDPDPSGCGFGKTSERPIIQAAK